MSSKKYKVVVSDTVIVPIVGSTKDANGRTVSFKFSLVCKRKGADELKEAMASETTTTEILRQVTTGWRDQRLVLEDDDSPADFNEDSFDALLDIAGMANLCFIRYCKENGAAEKN